MLLGGTKKGNIVRGTYGVTYKLKTAGWRKEGGKSRRKACSGWVTKVFLSQSLS